MLWLWLWLWLVHSYVTLGRFSSWLAFPAILSLWCLLLNVLLVVIFLFKSLFIGRDMETEWLFQLIDSSLLIDDCGLKLFDQFLSLHLFGVFMFFLTFNMLLVVPLVFVKLVFFLAQRFIFFLESLILPLKFVLQFDQFLMISPENVLIIL